MTSASDGHHQRGNTPSWCVLRYGPGVLSAVRMGCLLRMDWGTFCGMPRLIVLTAVGRAFETVDDIAVVPVTLLCP